MSFINFNSGKIVQIWDGISGTLAHTETSTFGYFTIENGTLLPEHSHIHEQNCHILEGELEFTIDGETQILTRGMAAFIPSMATHSARALTACKVLDCFTPVREDFVALEKQQS